MLNKIDDLQLLANHQYGFRREHSTTQQIIRLTDDITDNFNLTAQTGAVFLDIEKAFDKVWHDGLFYKMIRMGINKKLGEIIQSYLKNRKFSVKIDNQLSEERSFKGGVP